MRRGYVMVTLDDFTLSCGLEAGEITRCVRRFGAAVLLDFVDPSTLEKLRREFDRVLEDRTESYAYPIAYGPGRAVSLRRAAMPVEMYPTIRAFFESPGMQAVADRYVGHPCLLNSELYATHEFVPAADIAPTHFDKLWTLKFMLYVNDIDLDGGAFGIIPGSASFARRQFREIFDRHGLRVLSMNDRRYQAMGNDYVPPELGPVVNIVGAAGTLIVFDTDTYHHAGAVVDGHERMILRGHTGPSVVYSRVRRRSRQWWRGEKRFSKVDAWLDRLADRLSTAS